MSTAIETARPARLSHGVVYLLAAMAIVAAVYALTIRPGHNWGGDFSLYIAHAKNLVTGQPYNQTSYIPTRESAIRMPPSYPPVFPLLLAPLYGAFGLNYHAFKVLQAAILILAMVVYWRLALSRGLDPLFAAAATASFALTGLVLKLKESVVPDPAFLLIAGLVLLVCLRIYERGEDQRHPVLSAAVVAALSLAATATRPVGLTLPVALGCYELLRFRRIRKFLIATAVFFTCGFLLYTRVLYDTRVYGNQFWFSPGTYLQNVIFYLRAPAEFWSGAPGGLRQLFAVIGVVAAALGWWRCVRERFSILEVYAIAALGPLVIYSSSPVARYLLPILPLFFIYMVLGLTAWFKRLPVSPTVARGALLGFLALGAILNIRAIERGPIAEGIERPSFVSLCSYIDSHTPPDSVIASFNPRVLALYTRRPSIWSSEIAENAAFDSFLDRMHTKYLVLYSRYGDDNRWARPHVEANPAKYSRVYDNGEFSLYEVARP